MATHVHSTTATIIPFPARDVQQRGLFDPGTWALWSLFVPDYVARFGLAPDEVEVRVRAMIFGGEGSRDDLIDLLNSATAAKRFLTVALATLTKGGRPCRLRRRHGPRGRRPVMRGLFNDAAPMRVASAPTDPIIALHERWLALRAYSGDMSVADEEAQAALDKAFAIERDVAETQVLTMAGAIDALLWASTDFRDWYLDGGPTDPGSELLLDLIEGVVRFLRGQTGRSETR